MDLSSLLNIVKSSLQVMAGIVNNSPQDTETLKTVNLLFHKVVQISGTIHCTLGLIEIPVDVSQFLIFFVSIPWLAQFDPPWNDLPQKFGHSVDAIVRMGVVLSPLVSKENNNACLHLLAAFPSDAAPTWRTQVFLSVLVSIFFTCMIKSVCLLL